jgi:hypothetical protein
MPAADETSARDAIAAIRDCPVQPWTGEVWRCHSRKYRGDDPGGSIRTTGRFHRGPDKFPVSESWPALYTGLALHVALGERLRHTTPETLSQLGNQRISRLRVELQAVLVLCAPAGCAETGIDGLELETLCDPVDYRRCQQIAVIAREVAEALIIPSCTRFAEGNLVIFPDRLLPESSILVEETQDPDLFIDWGGV